MCCLFGCNNQRVIRGPMGPQGPRGGIGPMGPIGPSGTNNAVYLRAVGGTVGTGEIVPLTQVAATGGSSFIVTGNSIVLPENGTYLVTYSIDGSVANAGDVSASLYLNGTPITGETVTQNAGAGATVTGSRTALINGIAGQTLSLYNTSTQDVTLSNASLLALKTA